MASMELSLDEIIKKSKINVKPKGGFKKFGGNNAGNNRGNVQGNQIRRPGGVQQRRIGGTGITARGGGQNIRPNLRTNAGGIQKPIGDARNRIIQKKRLHLTDARDKLCELAKTTDARQKLEKLRLSRLGHNGAQAQLGYGLSTRKVPLAPFKAIHARTGLGGLVPAGLPLQRTINQPISVGRYPSKVAPLMDMDVDLADDYMTDAPIQLRRTVNNDQMRMQPLLRPSKLTVSSSPYSWKAPQQRIVPTSSSRGYIDLDYPAEERKRMKLPSPPPMMRPIVVSDDEDMPEPVRHTVRSSRTTSGNSMGVLKTRLEPSRAQTSSIPSASSSVTSGYRIVVSNLQSSVTHEDIRELFEDIGPLVTSRLVRPGTAEVVYRQYKDAERAVENYHNRQLDGQPMKCLLVKPRPSTASAAAPSGAGLRSSAAASAKSSSGKPSVVPDISTIHKALFNKA